MHEPASASAVDPCTSGAGAGQADTAAGISPAISPRRSKRHSRQLPLRWDCQQANQLAAARPGPRCGTARHRRRPDRRQRGHGPVHLPGHRRLAERRQAAGHHLAQGRDLPRQDHGTYRKDGTNEADHCLDWRSAYLLPYIRNLASFVNSEQQWQLNAVK